MISQMIKGAPKAVVTALMGRLVANPGNWAMVSQANRTNMPKRAVAGNNILWSLVLNNNLPKCGTAIPIKAMGPQNAVIPPVSIPVLTIMIHRNLSKFIPMLLA